MRSIDLLFQDELTKILWDFTYLCWNLTIDAIYRDSTITLWSPEGQKLKEFTTRTGLEKSLVDYEISLLALSQDATMLAACYSDQKCILWDTKTTQSQEITLQGELVGIVMLSGKPAMLIRDGDVLRVQDGSGPAIELFSLPRGTTDVKLNAARTRLIAASPSGVSVWDLSGQRVGGFAKKLETDSTVLPGSDLERIGIMTDSHSKSHEVLVFDQNGKQIQKFDTEIPRSLSPDGKLLATSEGIKHVTTLWDVETKTPVARFSDDTKNIVDIRFTSDGKFVAVRSLSKGLRLWDINTMEELVAKACQWIGDYLAHSPEVSAEDRKLCPPVSVAQGHAAK